MNISILLLDYTLTGGIERWVSVTSSLLRRCNCEVTIYSLFKTNDKPQFENPTDVKVVYLSQDAFFWSYKIPTAKILFNLKFKELNKYDLILSNNTIISCLLLLLKFRLRRKIISIEHSSVFSLRRPYSILRRLLYPHLRLAITQSQKSYAYLSSFCNSAVIPNPVTPFNDSKQWSCGKDLNGPINILGIFRDHPDKQPSHYFDAFNVLSRSKTKFNFRTVGFNTEKKLDYDHVGLECLPPTRNIRQHYEWADVLLLLSKTEAYPMVMLEALSFGVPVLFYDHLDGPNDIVAGKGYTFKVINGDFDDLEKKITALYSEGHVKELQTLCLEIAQDFSTDAILEKWKEVLKIAS